jgi:peptidoglycan/xylan/chitin deacetylase (PgdA/CDA1 family)
MILMYHNLATAAGFNTVSRENFLRQMDWLQANGYRVASMDDYVRALSQPKPDPRAVALTFDDAYQSFLAVALPILQGHSFHATVYVPTQFVGRSNTWDNAEFPILDWAGLKELAHISGVTVGSHGTSHRPLRSLPPAQLLEEVAQSKTELEENLDLPVRHFSYPYGQLRDFSRRCQDAVAHAGYHSACSTLWNRTNSQAHRYALHRLEIEPQDDIQRFSEKISRPFHPKFFRQRIKNVLYRLGLRR